MKGSKKKFLKAIKKNDYAQIQKFIIIDPDLVNLSVSYKNEYSDYRLSQIEQVNPLFLAVAKNDTELVKLLLVNQADPNIPVSNSQTPLFRALENKQNNIIRLLLEYGADVNFKDQHGKTPLFEAICAHELANIDLLLKHGANPNIKNDEGKTPFIVAARKNKREIVEMLLTYNININDKDKNEKTALFEAVENNNKGIIELLINCGADVNSKNKHGVTPLLCMVKKHYEDMCHEDIFLTLLAKSTEINPIEINNNQSCTDYIYSKNQKNPIIQSHYFCEALLRGNLILITEIVNKYSYMIKHEGFIHYLLKRELNQEQVLKISQFIGELAQREIFTQEFSFLLKKSLRKIKLG